MAVWAGFDAVIHEGYDLPSALEVMADRRGKGMGRLAERLG